MSQSVPGCRLCYRYAACRVLAGESLCWGLRPGLKCGLLWPSTEGLQGFPAAVLCCPGVLWGSVGPRPAQMLGGRGEHKESQTCDCTAEIWGAVLLPFPGRCACYCFPLGQKEFKGNGIILRWSRTKAGSHKYGPNGLPSVCLAFKAQWLYLSTVTFI